LAGRLEARRHEIEPVLLEQAISVPNAPVASDPEYLDGVRRTVSAGFDHSLSVIELEEGENPPPIPAEVLVQARLAARRSVDLDAVLCRYIACSNRLADFIHDECDGACARHPLRMLGQGLEQILCGISAGYKAERKNRTRSRDARVADHVAGVLRGDPPSKKLIDYDMNLNHVGLVAKGPNTKDMVGEVARALDSRLLVVRPDEETVWAWLGRAGVLHGDEVLAALGTCDPSIRCLAIGEAAAGVGGWRQTHLQAKAGIPVALKSANRQARYAEVCLIASALQDDLLRSSLYAIYLKPLLDDERGELPYVETLRAYFAADRNGASTASSLGVSRQTVVNRLHAVEERLGSPLSACAAAVELAVGMNDLEATC